MISKVEQVSLKNNKKIELDSGTNKIRITSEALTLDLSESEKSNEVEYDTGSIEYEPSLTADYYIVKSIGAFNEAELVIPAKHPLDDKPILKIKSNAFRYNETITTVKIPSSIQEIGSHAFAESKISTVIFDDMDDISCYVKFPVGHQWGDMTCILTDYAVSNTGTEIALQRIIYKGIDSPVVFNFVIPPSNGKQIIRFKSSDGTYQTEEYEVSKITSKNSTCLSVAKNTLGKNIVTKETDSFDVNSESLLSEFVPKNSLYIGSNAFDKCSNLQEINLPGRTYDIGTAAFAGCDKVRSITFVQDSRLRKIGQAAFSLCSGNATTSYDVVIPESVKNLGAECFNETLKMKSLQIPSRVGEIPARFVMSCTDLETVTGGGAVRFIGVGAFSGCTKLNNFIIPETVELINSAAFFGCFEYSGSYSTNPYKVIFNRSAGWFVMPQSTDRVNKYYENWTRVPAEQITNTTEEGQKRAAQMLSRASTDHPSEIPDCYAEYYWVNLRQMVAPTIELSADTLKMTDPLGVAEAFYIYIGDKPKAKIWPET